LKIVTKYGYLKLKEYISKQMGSFISDYK